MDDSTDSKVPAPISEETWQLDHFQCLHSNEPKLSMQHENV